MKRLLSLSWLPLISNRTKIIISISLVFFATIMMAVYGFGQGSILCFLAMCLSFFGDLFLNCKPIHSRPRKYLYIGALFFILAHILYSIAYYRMNEAKLWNMGSDLAVKLILLITLMSIIIAATREETTHGMTIFVFSMYIIVISINLLSIYTYSWNYNALSYIGATAFLASDYIIGVETILKAQNNTLRKLVWILYPIGQIMIIACR